MGAAPAFRDLDPESAAPSPANEQRLTLVVEKKAREFCLRLTA
jgi:hypothetical protein